MKPPKEPPKKSPGFVRRLLTGALAGSAKWFTLPLVLLAAFGSGTYLLWRQVREQVTSAHHYQVTPDSIRLSDPPPWIHADIAEEVLQQMNLGGPPSILDDDLCERLAKAFALHPWIAKVSRVEKRFPARVLIDVVYRRPVCMVEVPPAAGEIPNDEADAGTAGSEINARRGGLFPVDAAGVLLPTADFSRAEARRYPRLSGIHSLPIGPAGTPWGDARVQGGAQIAAVLLDDWTRLRLQRIVPSELPAPGGSSEDYCYEIFARNGTRILWGQRPASQLGGELSAAEKLARLRQYLGDPNRPRPEGVQLDIDIRYPAGVTTSPRTARAKAENTK
jgi:hypothetical protein